MNRTRVLVALFIVYLVWGSTYLAIRYAIETLPPLLMAGVRFMSAGAILYAFMRLRGTPAPERSHWRGAAIVGGLLLLGGNGAVVTAERFVPSGLAALMIATVPLWMVLLDWWVPGGRRPTITVFAGIVLGLAGIVVLVGPTRSTLAIDPRGAGLLVLATVSWATGSIVSRRLSLPPSPFMATAMEMLSGGAMLTAAGLAFGEVGRLDCDAISPKSLAAFVYLIVFGSLIAFSAYIWLLREATPAVVSTYAYVNPVVALVLGGVLAGETFTPRMMGASSVILAGVVLITLPRREK